MKNNDPSVNRYQPFKTIQIVFLHHSTGRHLIYQGNIRKLLKSYCEEDGIDYQLWEHDYNRIGLVDNHGQNLRMSFDIPNDNTNPDGLDNLFSQPIRNPPDNALSKLLMFDVVVFKSCFPVSAITSDKQLEEYKKHYISIRKNLSTQASVLFICMTPPPLIPLKLPVFAPVWTNMNDARRAREFAKWLTSSEFLDGYNNIITFDLFNELANKEDDPVSPNMLRPEYRGFLGVDSHPNTRANKEVAIVFIKFIIEHIRKFYFDKTK